MLSIPALREEADLLVTRIDPDAAEKRRKLAEQDRRVTFRPEGDGMAAAFALLAAHDAQELSARTDYIAGTVCDGDPRTLMQRRADGLMQLTRGFGTLGCQCAAAGCTYREARQTGEPDADGAVARFVTLINVVVNERDLADPSGTNGDCGHDDLVDASAGTRPAPGYLVGYGPITGEYARELAQRGDARIRPFGQRIGDPKQPAPGHRPAPDQAEPGRPAAHWSAVDFARAWATIVLDFEHPHDPGDGDGGGGPPGGPDGPPPADSPRGGPPPDPPAERPDPRGAPSRPAGGAPSALVSARGATGYRPSADLDRYIRLVFPRCVFPFCNRPASRAQLDHRREYDHRSPELGGRTTAEQIQPLCIAHHQLKTAGEWIDARMPDGRLLWTSPDGRRYLVDPSSTMLRLFPDLARVNWIVPEQKQTAPVPGGATHLQREHARRELLRRRNTAAMQAELDRRNRPRSIVEDRLTTRLGVPIPFHRRYDGPPPF